jgi:hypothetical protein
MLTELLICTLCTWQIVEVYHHSSLFASVRARLDLETNLLGSLSRCPWCLSVWVAAAAVVGYRLCVHDASYFAAGPLSQVISTGGMALAVSRLSNVCNDLVYNYSRTPRTAILDFVIGPPTTPEENDE